MLPKALAAVGARRRGVGALVSVPVAAAVFTLLFAIGGTVPVETVDTVLTAMVGWHTVIGIGEAIVTGLVVAGGDRRPPDLVYGARDLRCRPRQLEIRPGAAGGEAAAQPQGVLRAMLLVALLIAGVGSYYASGHPDGLDFVAEETGFCDSADEPKTADSPFADYGTSGSRRRPAQRRASPAWPACCSCCS